MPAITTSDGVRISYADWGNGRPLVFLHGWGVNSDMWEYQLPSVLDAGLRCVSYDRRGFGLSDRPGQGYGYDRLAEDLAELMTALDLTEAVLVSHSMGSGEVARYLANHGSARVAGVVLISPTLPYLMAAEDNEAGIDPAVFDSLMQALTTDRPGLLAQLAPGALGVELPGVSLSEPLVDWARSLFYQGSAQANIACFTTHWTTDQRADLAAFDRPTLVLHGANDSVVPLAATAARLESALAQGTLKVYDNASHWMFLTHRDQVNADLRTFVKAL